MCCKLMQLKTKRHFIASRRNDGKGTAYLQLLSAWEGASVRAMGKGTFALLLGTDLLPSNIPIQRLLLQACKKIPRLVGCEERTWEPGGHRDLWEVRPGIP